MLDLNFVRNNLELVKRKVETKGVNFNEVLFLRIDKKRRKLITKSENLKSKKKKIAKEIGVLKRKNLNTKGFEKESVELSKDISIIEKDLNEVKNEFRDLLFNIPNLFDDSVPIGKNESGNVVVREWGQKPEFNFKPKPHWELGEINSFLDFTRAAKMSGSRFSISFGNLAKLERVLINFMLETHTKNGYRETIPPFMVNEESLIGTGNLPKFKKDLYKIEDYNLYLIPTAEVPLTNIYRDEILKKEELPKKYVAYSPCFRSEAGSHGKDIRGIIRQHQFNKVELLKFCTPETSYDELEKLTRDAESILQRLNLHYRVVLLCSGDMSFTSAKTYDIDVWMPARNDYVEISSCSNFEDFQARRARIKYIASEGKKLFVNTLNGSGLALGRTVAAIMENYQIESGKILIPDILKEYFIGSIYL